MSSVKTNIIIPARLASTRLPRKVLLEHKGQSLIKRVVRQALKVAHCRVIVATEDPEIVDHLQNVNNIEVCLTPSFSTGTQRSFYLCRQLDLQGALISWQADEPCIEPQWVESLAQAVRINKMIATLIAPNKSLDDFLSTSCVKTVVTCDNHAMYFSRSPIPGNKTSDYAHSLPFYQHIGLYAFNCGIVNELSQLSEASLNFANLEDLEQLQWLHAGFKIHCTTIDASDIIGIDTLTDWEQYCQVASL